MKSINLLMIRNGILHVILIILFIYFYTVHPDVVKHLLFQLYLKLQIEIPEHYGIRKIVFYDTNGSIAKVLSPYSEHLVADINELQAGLYILKFFDVDNNTKYLTKLFVNK